MFQCKHCGNENAIRWNAYGDARCKYCKKPWTFKDEHDRRDEEFNLLSPPKRPLKRQGKEY